jgi:hypothetical protein
MPATAQASSLSEVSPETPTAPSSVVPSWISTPKHFTCDVFGDLLWIWPVQTNEELEIVRRNAVADFLLHLSYNALQRCLSGLAPATKQRDLARVDNHRDVVLTLEQQLT